MTNKDLSSQLEGLFADAVPESDTRAGDDELLLEETVAGLLEEQPRAEETTVAVPTALGFPPTVSGEAEGEPGGVEDTQELPRSLLSRAQSWQIPAGEGQAKTLSVLLRGAMIVGGALLIFLLVRFAWPNASTEPRLHILYFAAYALAIAITLVQWVLNSSLTKALRETENGQAEALQSQSVAEGRADELATANALLQRRAYQLQGAASIGARITPILELKQLAQQAVNVIREELDLYYVGLFLIDEADGDVPNAHVRRPASAEWQRLRERAVDESYTDVGGQWAVLQAGTGEAGNQMLARDHRLEVSEASTVGWCIANGEVRIGPDPGVHVRRNAPPHSKRRHSDGAPSEWRLGKDDGAPSEWRLGKGDGAPSEWRLGKDDGAPSEWRLGKGDGAPSEWRLGKGDGAPPNGVADLSTEYLNEDHAQIQSLLPETRSQVALPLRSQVGGRDRVIGALDLQSSERDAFSQGDIAVLQAIVDQTAAALDNARLFAEAQEKLEKAEIRHRRYAHQKWGDSMSAGAARYERTQQDVAPLAQSTASEDGDQLGQAIERAMTQQEIVVQTATGNGTNNAALVAPISLRGEILGTLGLHDTERRQWTDDEVALIEAVADQMALAIENARLLRETEQWAERERLSADIAARVRASTDVDTILRTAIRELGQALRASDGMIRLSAIRMAPQEEGLSASGMAPQEEELSASGIAPPQEASCDSDEGLLGTPGNEEYEDAKA